MQKTYPVLIFLFCCGWLCCQTDAQIRGDVPFVPTQEECVAEMLKMAEVTAQDIVYDLGCGDGRIVVAAAKRGARAVGIDINPVRIKESNENAKKAQVTDKVKFIQQNLFQADISEATVLTLYLLPEVNLRLRPKLLQELRPGTRIVSHDFHMGKWKADKSFQKGYYFDIYYWMVPANVTGSWNWDNWSLTLEQHFQEVKGIAASGDQRIAIQDTKLLGTYLEFTIKGDKTLQRFKGKVSGHIIEGTLITDTGEKEWKARRNPATVSEFFDAKERY